MQEIRGVSQNGLVQSIYCWKITRIAPILVLPIAPSDSEMLPYEEGDVFLRYIRLFRDLKVLWNYPVIILVIRLFFLYWMLAPFLELQGSMGR